MIWQSKVDRGIDPMSAISNNDGSRSSGDEEDYCFYDGMIRNMEDHVGNGIESFEKEFQNDVSSSCSTDKNDDDSTNIQNENDGTDSKPIIHNSLKACALVRSGDEGNNNSSSNNNTNKRNDGILLPPLPLQIFSPDATVVLPQALTASQLFDRMHHGH
jgi:hypothetical protein